MQKERITVGYIFDRYQETRENPFDDRPCLHPKGVAYTLKVPRAAWGLMLLSEFRQGSKSRVRDQVQAWREAGKAQSTVRKYISLTIAAFNSAVDNEIIERHELPVIKLPRPGDPRRRFVDAQRELPALLKAANSTKIPDHIRLKFHLQLRTGQRSGAVQSLRWSKHFDWERRIILFSQTQPPSERSKKRRTDQPMDAELYAMLRAAQERADSDAVIERHGKPVKSSYWGMKKLYALAGVENLHIHDLRRSAATYVDRELGGDIGAAAGFIGDTEKMTSEVYVIDDPAKRLRQVQAISDLIARAAA